MFNIFGGKKLESILDATKIIRIHGVRFTIRKINVLHYLDGSKALSQHYDLYKSGKKNIPIDFSDKKILEHFQHVLYSGLVKPKVSLTENDDGIFVEKFFTDFDLVLSLYNEIMQFTNGKKSDIKYLSREKLLELDLISRRYSQKPSSFLKDDVNDFQFNILVARVGLESENKTTRKGLNHGK